MLYRFGPYEIRTRSRELYKQSLKLKLRPQPFQVLEALVEHPGEVVTREELRTLLWPAETFVDFEHGLNTAIKELRAVLNDSASKPRYIETLPRVGYRMLAPVEAQPPPKAANPGVANPQAESAPTSIRAERPGWRWTRAVIVCAIVVIPALAGWLALSRPEPEMSMPVPLTSFPGAEVWPAWSPDGRQIAFLWNGEQPGGPDHVYALQPGASQPRRLTVEPGQEGGPAWSPDGRRIAYSHIAPDGRRSLRVVSSLGGGARVVLSGAGMRFGPPSWMRDGRTVVLEIVTEDNKPAALWAVKVDSGESRQLTWPPAGIHGDTAAAVSPDGRSLAFCRTTAWRTAELYLLDLQAGPEPAGEPRRMTELGYVERPAWTPDSRRILFGAYCEGAGICEIDRKGGRVRPVLGAPESASLPAIAKRPDGNTSLVFSNFADQSSIWRYRRTAEVSLAPETAHFALAADHSPAGLPVHEISAIVGPGSGSESSAAPDELVPSSRSQDYPRYSPDGKKLAFASNRSGHWEIWVARADGSQPIQLTDLRHVLTEQPDWSPAGDVIAFVSQQGAHRQVYLVPSSGGPARMITHEEGVHVGGGWARDGSGYYYASERSGRREVWKAAREGGSSRQITTSGAQNGFESTRGVFYYWPLEGGRRAPLMRWSETGSQPVPLAGHARPWMVSVSPEGFYYREAETGDIYLYEEASGRSTRVLGCPARWNGEALTVSPDARWFAGDIIRRENVDLMMMERFR